MNPLNTICNDCHAALEAPHGVFDAGPCATPDCFYYEAGPICEDCSMPIGDCECDDDCSVCRGTGSFDRHSKCNTCNGTGIIERETEEENDDNADEAAASVRLAEAYIEGYIDWQEGR